MRQTICGVSVLAALALIAATTGSVPGARAADQQPLLRSPLGAEVFADTYDYDLPARTLDLEGNVRLISARARMTAAKMRVQWNEERVITLAKAEGGVTLAQEGEGDVTIEGQAAAGEFRETDRTALLTGGVTVHYRSPDLAEPAVLRGARAQLDLGKGVTTIHRGKESPVTIRVQPRGKPDGPKPDPIVLSGDRVDITRTREGTEYVATGQPLLTTGESRLRASRLRFVIEPETNDVAEVYAENDVEFEGKGRQGGRGHLTGRHAVFQRRTQLVTVTGDVRAEIWARGDERPHLLRQERLVYNLETERVTGSGGFRGSIPPRQQPRANPPSTGNP